jgi:tripartite-type tricarboxylate transporter receptor subunit TctC
VSNAGDHWAGPIASAATLACAITVAVGPQACLHAEQPYPSRAVEITVPFAAGGGSDVIARLLAEGLSARLGQSFLVLHRPGANSNIGIQAVARAPPDGYSLVMASIGLTANPSLYKKLPFDPLKDLAPISLIANAPTILVVHPSLPISNVEGLIAFAKAHPGELNYASYGAGSGPHLAAELFQSLTGTKLVHVPYGGGAPAALGVVNGSVQMLFASVLPVLGMVRGGALKAVAIASDHRLPLLPEVPTFTERGIDYQTGTWFGLLAPARTPPAVVTLLHHAIADVLADTTVRNRLIAQGAEIVGNSPDEFRAFIKDEMERLSIAIRSANIQLD